jgi:hypothetical protein
VEDNKEDKKKPVEGLEIPPISFEPPKPPRIRREVQAIIDKLLPALTQDEFQYLISKAKENIKATIQHPPNPLPMMEPPQQTQQEPKPVDPLFGDMVEGLKELEEVVTFGYPKFHLSQEPEPSLSNDILGWIGDRLDKILENPKVGDQLARLLGALADKLEGKT